MSEIFVGWEVINLRVIPSRNSLSQGSLEATTEGAAGPTQQEFLGTDQQRLEAKVIIDAQW